MNFTQVMEAYEGYYKEHFASASARFLVEQEQLLSDIIDSDGLENVCILSEVISLREIIRDECVHRVSLMVQE